MQSCAKAKLFRLIGIRIFDTVNSSHFIQKDGTLLSSRSMALKYGTVSHLLPETYKRMVSDWLEEDCPSFDYSGFVVGGAAAEAKLLGKSHVSFDLLPFFEFNISVLLAVILSSLKKPQIVHGISNGHNLKESSSLTEPVNVKLELCC